MGSADWTAGSHATVEGGLDQKQHPCEFYDLGMSEESRCGAAGEERGRVAGFQSLTNASADPHVGDAHIKPNIDGKRPCDVTDDPEHWPLWQGISCAQEEMGRRVKSREQMQRSRRAPEAIMSLSGSSCELAAQCLNVSDLSACRTAGGGMACRKPVRPWGRGGKSWALTLPSWENECVHLGLNYGVERPLRIFKGHWLCVCTCMCVLWCQSAGVPLRGLPVCLRGLCCFL